MRCRSTKAIDQHLLQVFFSNFQGVYTHGKKRVKELAEGEGLVRECVPTSTFVSLDLHVSDQEPLSRRAEEAGHAHSGEAGLHVHP